MQCNHDGDTRVIMTVSMSYSCVGAIDILGSSHCNDGLQLLYPTPSDLGRVRFAGWPDTNISVSQPPPPPAPTTLPTVC